MLNRAFVLLFFLAVAAAPVQAGRREAEVILREAIRLQTNPPRGVSQDDALNRAYLRMAEAFRADPTFWMVLLQRGLNRCTKADLNRSMLRDRLQLMRTDELMAEAKRLGAPYHILVQTAELGKLPVPNFAAGGIATPADAALMMQLGAETVFVGSGIFASNDPAPRAKAIVDAVTFFDDPAKLMEISMNLGEAIKGRAVNEMDESEKMAGRGW